MNPEFVFYILLQHDYRNVKSLEFWILRIVCGDINLQISTEVLIFFFFGKYASVDVTISALITFHRRQWHYLKPFSSDLTSCLKSVV